MSIARRPGDRSICLATAAVLALPVALYFVDPIPRYFIGDSTTYLQTSFFGTVPAQRSFVYGFLVRAFTRPTGSIDALILGQVLASTLTLGLVLHRLCRRIPVTVALGLGVAIAIEPIRLLMQRYVMTEAFGSLLFAASLLCWLEWLAGRRLRWLAVAQTCGLLAVSLRFAFLPVVLGLSLLAPAIAYFPSSDHAAATRAPAKRTRALRLRDTAIALLASLALTAGGFAAYERLHTELLGRAAPVFGYDGFFLLGVACPLVTPDLAHDPRVARELAEPLIHVTRDPVFGRGWEIFDARGLIRRLAALAPAIADPNRLAGELARAAIARDPVRFIALGLPNVTAYFDRDLAWRAARIERGTDQPLSERGAAAVMKRLPSSTPPTADDGSLTQRWHAAAQHWPGLLALSPLLAALGFAARPHRVTREAVLLFAGLAAVVGTAVFLAAMPVPRYLHEVPILAALLLGEWFGAASGLRGPPARVLSAPCTAASTPDPASPS